METPTISTSQTQFFSCFVGNPSHLGIGEVVKDHHGSMIGVSSMPTGSGLPIKLKTTA